MNLFRLILLIFIFSGTVEAYPALVGIRTADREGSIARVVFDFLEKQAISQKINPRSLEITLPSSSLPSIKNQSTYIQNIQNQSYPSKTIFLISTKKELAIKKAFWISPDDNNPLYRYVVDLSVKSKETSDPLPSQQEPPEKKKIIIDPGHGGKDPGTIGFKKIYEKKVTLAVAKRLAKKLNETGRYTAILLRSEDVSMSLAQRLRNARTEKGDLFISLHADSCEGNDTRGLSIYTLSSVASDKQAERLARKENKADLLIGVDLQSELPEVAHILIDLTKRETMNLSTKFAQSLISKLRERIFLLRKPHRFADFFILKSADLPSVLIELGYLSHPKEAVLLIKPEYQEVICEGIKEAIDTYFSAS